MYFASDTFSQKTISKNYYDLFRYIDNNKGFAYIPIGNLPKKEYNSLCDYDALGTLESFECWKKENPNKVIVQIIGDGLGKDKPNKGFFIIYNFIEEKKELK